METMISIAISGDEWPDEVRLSDIEYRFVCKAAATAVPTSARTCQSPLRRVIYSRSNLPVLRLKKCVLAQAGQLTVS